MNTVRVCARSFAALFVLFCSVTTQPLLAQEARIAGTVVDAETGETLVGATVSIDGTQIGTTTDLDGRFALGPLNPGEYDVVFRFLGFTTKTVTGAEAQPGGITKIDVALSPESIGLEEVVVEASALRNTDAALLRNRSKAAALSDAISAEAIGRSGSSTASDAMKKVTGASVVGGKYVYVRGLGDRYVNTQLNGINLPSADPDRNAVPLDIFPSGLLDNITTLKTFTPDQPGNFTGGSVNLNTNSFPDRRTLTFSTSMGSNTEVGSQMLLYQNGAPGIFSSNRVHDLPGILADRNVHIPAPTDSYRDLDKAQQLDAISKAFQPVMTPSYVSAPINQSYGVTFGNQTLVAGRPLGLIGSFSYSTQASAYTGGATGLYALEGLAGAEEELHPLVKLADTRGSQSALWGGLATLSFKPHPRHSFSATLVYNRSDDSEARYLSGEVPRDLSGQVVETRVLSLVERTIASLQARGEHVLGGGANPIRARWNASFSATRQDEPDRRVFTDNYAVITRGERVDTFYAISQSVYNQPSRYFRNLDEDQRAADLDVTVPFRQWNGLSAQLKVGGSYLQKHRTFDERAFAMLRDGSNVIYAGDPEDFFSVDNVGIDTVRSRPDISFYRFRNYVSEQTSPSSRYDGDMTVGAGYLMVDVPLLPRLRFIGGARLERTRLDVGSHLLASGDTVAVHGGENTLDVLPSASVVYQLTDKVNLRAAYGKTLARPTFRELAPYASFEFVEGLIFNGNPDLDRTLVDNFDLRWEWFPRPGEIVAASGFVKDFSDPIERVVLDENGNVTAQNVDHAQVYGMELEVHQRLDRIHPWLRFLSAGANLTLAHSRVAVDPTELAQIRELDPTASGARPMEGQSPYVVNVNLGYDSGHGTSISAFYNVFGPRLVDVTYGATPDLYEQPRHIVDLTMSQNLVWGLALKASVKNVLGQQYRVVYPFKGTDYAAQQYALGRSFSVGLKYNL